MELTRQGYQLNTRLLGLLCIRCNRALSLNDPVVDFGTGCPVCLSEGHPAALLCFYEDDELIIDDTQRHLNRYRGMLPYQSFPSLGEGETPCLCVSTLAQDLGVRHVWVKNEGQNPTGSHKDRMSALAVARAADLSRHTVIAASSGNAGASLAAYAAAAGLECCIVGSPDISSAWESAITSTGAALVKLDDQQRWPYLRKMVSERNWYPVTNFNDPPISSSPFGIEGYKTIAYELIEDVYDIHDSTILVPTCRGDLLAGIAYGFTEAVRAGMLHKMPRLVAVEPAARLEKVLAGADFRDKFVEPPNSMVSIGGNTATYQSVHALQLSNGFAVSVSNEEAIAAKSQLAKLGFFVELSSASSLAAAVKLAEEKRLGPRDNLVLLVTSHGYKQLPGAEAGP
jgi:threonine synthase